MRLLLIQKPGKRPDCNFYTQACMKRERPGITGTNEESTRAGAEGEAVMGQFAERAGRFYIGFSKSF